MVQGITEFLPVSSSAHLVLLPAIGSWEAQTIFFDVMLHFATLLVIIIYFRKDILSILTSSIKSPKLVINILLTSIPTFLVGYFFYDLISKWSDNLFVISFMLIGVGILFLFSGKLFRNAKKKTEQLSLFQATLIGVGQALAFVRGTSRSGITILAGQQAGLSLKEATKYAFIAGIPVILAASLYEMLNVDLTALSSQDMSTLTVGFLSSFTVGLGTIHILVKILNRFGLKSFGYYRILLGIGILLYSVLR